jgi:hypothetical protein
MAKRKKKPPVIPDDPYACGLEAIDILLKSYANFWFQDAKAMDRIATTLHKDLKSYGNICDQMIAMRHFVPDANQPRFDALVARARELAP